MEYKEKSSFYAQVIRALMRRQGMTSLRIEPEETAEDQFDIWTRMTADDGLELKLDESVTKQ